MGASPGLWLCWSRAQKCFNRHTPEGVPRSASRDTWSDYVNTGSTNAGQTVINPGNQTWDGTLAIRKNKNLKRFLLKVENSISVGKYIAIFPGFEPNSEPIRPGQRISIIEPGGECRSASIAGLSLLNAINGIEQVQIMLSTESFTSSITPKSEIWMIPE